MLSLYAEPLLAYGPLAGEEPRRYPLLMDLWHQPKTANACFWMGDVPDGTFVGLMRRALTAWTSGDSPGTISFDLHRSPDAGSRVTVRAAPKGLVGEITSSGPFPGSSSTERRVAARRVGPPDPRVCGIQPRA